MGKLVTIVTAVCQLQVSAGVAPRGRCRDGALWARASRSIGCGSRHAQLTCRAITLACIRSTVYYVACSNPILLGTCRCVVRKAQSPELYCLSIQCQGCRLELLVL